jgi:hypothetical protein
VENLVLNYLMPIFGSFISFLALMLTRKLLLWLHIKLGIATDDKFQRDLEAAVKDAIYAAEEKAATQVKQGLPQWTSGMKYKWAVEILGKQFPQLTREQADIKVNAMLGRSLGLGSTKDLGEQCKSTPQCEDVKLSPIAEAELLKP